MLRTTILSHRRFVSINTFNFVPKHAPLLQDDVEAFKKFLAGSTRLLALTGAGVSTESGIPDYRSENVGLYARSNRRPILHQEFLDSAYVRRRYWARNFVGWPRFSARHPNATHFALKRMQDEQRLLGLVTQNVDNLHTKAGTAGTADVVELHGSAFRVNCLTCSEQYARETVQHQLMELNPALKETANMLRPDGDVDVSDDVVEVFKPPFCEACGGDLKPDIVFFGDFVPRQRLQVISKLINECDSVLVLGSSLSVLSGYRIVLQAHEMGKDIAIVNIGETRADNLAHLKISANCGDIFTEIPFIIPCKY